MLEILTTDELKALPQVSRQENRVMNSVVVLTEEQVRSIANEAAKTAVEEILKRVKTTDQPRPAQVTQKQVAEMLGITPATVCNMVKSGRIRVNRCGKIPAEEVDRILSIRADR